MLGLIIILGAHWSGRLALQELPWSPASASLALGFQTVTRVTDSLVGAEDTNSSCHTYMTRTLLSYLSAPMELLNWILHLRSHFTISIYSNFTIFWSQIWVTVAQEHRYNTILYSSVEAFSQNFYSNRTKKQGHKARHFPNILAETSEKCLTAKCRNPSCEP